MPNGSRVFLSGGGWFITPGLLARLEYVDQPDELPLNGVRMPV